jgi:HD-GYP domain-containing protein (c-di-GMP phosphodiesterase class II)
MRVWRRRRAAGVSGAGEQLVAQARQRDATELDRRERVATLALAAAFLATAVALPVLVQSPRAARLDLVVVLTACYALAARVQFEVGFGFAVPTQLILVPMLFLAPPTWVPVLVVAGSALSRLPEQVRGDSHPERLALHLVSAWYSVGPVLVLWGAGWPSATASHLPVMAVALAAQFGFDLAAAAVRGCVGLGLSLRSIVEMLAPAWLVDLALTPVGLAMAIAATGSGFGFALGIPLTGLLAYFARERRARIDHALELSHAYRGTALLLGDMVEADDSYTGLHSQDVVSLVVAVAEHMQLSERDRLDAELTALLHDVGKVRIPKEIITKPGPLTPAERAVIETHTVVGEQMLEKIGGLLGHVGRLVRSCHEHWDGAGYPDRLAGERIPLVSRIVCACDAFSAMTTDRSYRPARPAAEALAELHRCAGTQFDPAVVRALAVVCRSAERPVVEQRLDPAA